MRHRQRMIWLESLYPVAKVVARRRAHLVMPSKSPAQARLMNIAAHTPGGYGGVPQSVGEEFHSADKAAGKFSMSAKHPHHEGKVVHNPYGKAHK